MKLCTNIRLMEGITTHFIISCNQL
jgi:hypothetical protein